MNRDKNAILSDNEILNKIYIVRNQKVMIDLDLAELYDVETKRLKESVRRNMGRFPEDFMFEMTSDEFEIWRSQNVTSKEDRKGLRYAPFCFTEQGVTMLSCVLNSERAIEMNLRIIRIFTKLRETLLTNHEILLKSEKLDKRLMNIGHDIEMHDGEIETILELIKEITSDREKPSGARISIGFKTKSSQ